MVRVRGGVSVGILATRCKRHGNARATRGRKEQAIADQTARTVWKYGDRGTGEEKSR